MEVTNKKLIVLKIVFVHFFPSQFLVKNDGDFTVITVMQILRAFICMTFCQRISVNTLNTGIDTVKPGLTVF